MAIVLYRSPLPFRSLVRSIQISAARLGYRLQDNVQDCYQVLRVDEDASDVEVKESYLKLAKQYHPDSAATTADPNKFAQLETAYSTIQSHRKREACNDDDGEKQMEVFDIRHTAPQHRQYLSFEGVGVGSLSQRQRQYQKFKVARAAENVYSYRQNQMAAQYESALVSQDKKATKKQTIRNAMDRLVEDLIQEAMTKGEFDNLEGKGKPLSRESVYNPMIDSTTHNLNKIMINNGYAPEWIMLERDIRSRLDHAKEELIKCRISAGPEPISKESNQKWLKQKEMFSDELRKINSKIEIFNLTVPTLRQQMMPRNIEKEIMKIVKHYKRMEASGTLPRLYGAPVEEVKMDPQDRVSLKEMWREWKAMFSSSR